MRRRRSPSWRASTWSSSDRKSTRLNSSHLVISYAVFCLKKKTKDTVRARLVAHLGPPRLIAAAASLGPGASVHSRAGLGSDEVVADLSAPSRRDRRVFNV